MLRRFSGLTKLPPMQLALGGKLDEVSLAWELVGDWSLPAERTVVIFPSLSHGSHVVSTPERVDDGWWEGMIGPGRWIDTNKLRVLCASPLGSPLGGGTSPLSPCPDDGLPWRARFPQITPADQAAAYAALLQELGLPRVHAVVGGSLGGMAALQFASHFPDAVARVAVLNSTPRSSPASIALRSVQRAAVLGDPAWKAGNYAPNEPPVTGLSVARGLGMVGFRTRHEWDARFQWQPVSDAPHFTTTSFEVESYLRHHGSKFAHAFDANCFLLLSKCADLMDLGAGYDNFAAGVTKIKARTMLVGVEEDVITPLAEMKSLAELMMSHGMPVSFHALHSKYGHDSFLLDLQAYGSLLKSCLEAGLEEQLEDEARWNTGLPLP